LLNKLALNNSELLEIALEEHHLLLLGAVVGSTEHVVILLACLV
jgi:ribosomal protein L3